MTEEEERSAVVKEALTWEGTPYHHMGKKKGVGIDCGQLITQVFAEAGVHPEVDFGSYAHDWHMHRAEEKYLKYVQSYMGLVNNWDTKSKEFWDSEGYIPPQPGDLLVWRYGRTYSHGGIVIKWPVFIHAFFPLGMVISENFIGHPLMSNSMLQFSFWRK